MPYYSFDLVDGEEFKNQGGIILEDIEVASDRAVQLASELSQVKPELRRTGCAVRVTDRDVQLDSGEVVGAGTVICTIGTQPNPLVEALPAPKSRGRIAVNSDMSVPGLEGMWAAGDCAAVVNAFDGKASPPTAQFAEAEASQLAANIVASLQGRPTQPFSYHPRGQLSSIGHNKAVAEIMGVRLSGFVAWLLWRGLHLLRIPTLSRKTRLFLEWNWAMFFPPDIAHFGYRRTRRRATQAEISSASAPQSTSSPDAQPAGWITDSSRVPELVSRGPHGSPG